MKTGKLGPWCPSFHGSHIIFLANKMQAEVPRQVLLLSQQGKACQEKKSLFPIWSPLLFLPGTQIRWLEVLQPSCGHEAPHWRMRATVLRTVMQQDSWYLRKKAAAPALRWPHLVSHMKFCLTLHFSFLISQPNTFLSDKRRQMK